MGISLRRRPPNFDSLSVEDRVLVDENVYRLQFKWTHGYSSNSSLLKSKDKIKEEFGV